MLFRRTPIEESTPVDEPAVPAAESAKGRPTPKRRDAQAQRAIRVKPPKDKREAYKLQREQAREDRSKTRNALLTGDERHLPSRDKGPVRKFVRDQIDSRRTIGEFFILIGFVVVILSLVPDEGVKLFAQTVFMALFVLLVVEGSLLGFRLRRQLNEGFPPESGPYDGRRGAIFYGIMRAFQLRRLRLPKPQVKPGARV